MRDDDETNEGIEHPPFHHHSSLFIIGPTVSIVDILLS
jgi:hypothetical protein